MEVSENKKGNNGWIRVIILIAIGVIIAIGGALRAEAQEYDAYLDDYHHIVCRDLSESQKYKFYRMIDVDNDENFKYVQSYNTETNRYKLYMYVVNPDFVPTVIVNDDEWYLYTDGSTRNSYTSTRNVDNWSKFTKMTSSNGDTVYYYGIWENTKEIHDVNYSYQFNNLNMYYVEDINDFNGLYNNYISMGVEPDEEYIIPTEEMDMALVGFECNEYLEASWTGVTGISDNAYDDLYVEVKPSYLLLLEEGEQIQDFDKPDTINVPFQTYSFSNTYDYYFANNPYAGRAILTLKFTPVLNLNGMNPVQYRGKTIEVRFDVDGNYGGYDVPIESMTPQYNGFEFTNFRVSSLIDDSTRRNAKILCGWDGFSLDNTINYVYRDVKVEIYCYEEITNSWKWLEYPNGDLYIGQGRLDLWMREMFDYASSKGMLFRCQKGSTTWLDCQIRLTPYYKTYTEYIYGKSILITTTGVGGIKSYEQSTSDVYNTLYPIYEDLREDYQKDNTVIGDFMDNIINGGDEDGEELNLDDVTFNFFTLLKSLLSACGQFPALFAAVFSFLPDYFVSMLVLSFSLIIILRVIGR